METSDNLDSTTTCCSVCNKELKINSLGRHMREIHPKIENIINCRYCEKTFARKSNLTRHIESNHPETLQVDPAKVLEDESESDSVTSKDKEKEKKFRCDHCGLSFKQKCHYTEHLQIHQGYRFHCSHCSKSFSRITTLKHHVQSRHSGNMQSGAVVNPPPKKKTKSKKEKKVIGMTQPFQENHTFCKNVAFLPHDGHIDFLHDCGNISCRDDASKLDSSQLYPDENCHGQEHSLHRDTSSHTHYTDHRACTKIAFLKHEDHVDFLHSCGSLFCHDEEVSFGQPPQIHDNLHAFATHSTEGNTEGDGQLKQPTDHSACKNVAFLPHDGHIDFLHNCGNVTCRDDINNNVNSVLGKRQGQNLDGDNTVDVHESSGFLPVQPSCHPCQNSTDNVENSFFTTMNHNQQHGNLPPTPLPTMDLDHSACTTVAFLKHEDHLDFLHSCGSLFCHDEEVTFGEPPQTHDNLCQIDQDIASAFLF